MTKGSPENPQGGAGKKPTKNDASKDKAAQTRKGANDEAPPQGKPARKVAKTMLEGVTDKLACVDPPPAV